MFSRRVLPLVVAGAALAAGLGSAALGSAGPASASVRYDPKTKAGFVGAADVRKAFGWSDASLAARASGLAFSHDFWTQDTYSVSCGHGSFPVDHQREFGRFELTDVVVRAPRRDASTGYGQRPRLLGFRIDGPYAGVSGTSVAPTVGQPCPKPRGPRITEVDLVSTITGWSFNVGSGGTDKILSTRSM